MQVEKLTFEHALTEAAALGVASALQTVKGVRRVAISTVNGTVDVSYDEEQTSPQELRFALKRAGIGEACATEEAQGTCCGRCSG